MRPLTFSDDKDHEQKWLPGGAQSAFDAFRDFIDRHFDNDNGSFCIEDEENEEALWLMFDVGMICRMKGAQYAHSEFRHVTNDGDYSTLPINFIRGGFAALDFKRPWWPDVASFELARLRSEFDGSVLRRTHPRELRRRLEILTRIDGREPTTIDGVTRYGFGNGGDTVNAWFTADGSGLVATFDHTSPLDFSDDARAQAALYDGVPADLHVLVRDVPEVGTIRNVPHPDGGTVVAATGIFTLSGPCAMTDGLVSRLREERLAIEDTGVGRLLETFLALEELTPATVGEVVDRWSAEDIARGFATAAAGEKEQSATVPLDRQAVNRFCKIWADSGYNDRWDVHYVLFDGRTLEEAGGVRDELLRLIQTLGLERVDAPSGAAAGEVWVRTDPRMDAELEGWS